MTDDLESGNVVAYSIRLKPETGNMELNTSMIHNDFLWWLSENGGETIWDPAKVTPEVQAHMAELWPLGVVTVIPILGGNRVHVKLTDLGRRAATEIRRKRIS